MARPGVVVVSGASGGVGRAVARAFAGRGAAVGLLARGESGLEGAERDVKDAGARALAVPTDVADFDQVQSAADQVERELGPIDTWVNVAFSSVFAPFQEITMDEFHRTTEVTYLGFVHGTRAALDRMLPRDKGTIVQTGSALAYRGIPLQTAYCGAKHAIQGFNEALRCELLHSRSGVRTTMVQLPAVNTPQFDWLINKMPRHAQPVPPIYQPEVIAKAIVYAAEHPKRREYWVGASTVGTLVANAIAPGLLDRYLAKTGFKSQQADEPKPAGEHGNLWEPSDGADGTDHGAHGSFDDKATGSSAQVWLSQHHGTLAAAGAVAAAAAGAVAVRRT